VSDKTEGAAPQFMPLLELPSGVMIRPDQILYIARKEIGKYMAIMDSPFNPQMPLLDLGDIEFLKNLGVVQELPKAAAANDAKPLVEVPA
jgi:hypothetical protein